jgi:hypothetical protein
VLGAFGAMHAKVADGNSRMTAAASSDDGDPAAADARGARTVKQSVEPVPGRFSRLAAVGKTIGSWLVGAAFFVLVIFAIATAGKAAVWVQPYVGKFSAAVLAIVLPLSLLLLLFRRTRGYGGPGLCFASFPLGLTLWVDCFAYALSVSVFWTVFGVLLGALGVAPIAAIMTLIRRDWSSFGTIIGTAVGVFLLRVVGAWIVEKADGWRAAAEERAATAYKSLDKRGNYFARHWRGQLPLGVSYWINKHCFGHVRYRHHCGSRGRHAD